MILPLDFKQGLLHLCGKMKISFPLTFSDLIVQLSFFDSLRHICINGTIEYLLLLEDVVYLVFE
jgi:hypothetical protein